MFEMIKNIPKFFELFKEGKEIANATTWKNRTVAVNAFIAFLGTVLALAHSFGFSVLIDDATIADVSAGVVAMVTAVNAVMHTITSSRVGLSSNGGSDSTKGPTADGGQTQAG